MEKPGKPQFSRLTVSLKPKAMQRLSNVKEALQREAGESFSVSFVIRKAIDCLADKLGV